MESAKSLCINFEGKTLETDHRNGASDLIPVVMPIKLDLDTPDLVIIVDRLRDIYNTYGFLGLLSVIMTAGRVKEVYEWVNMLESVKAAIVCIRGALMKMAREHVHHSWPAIECNCWPQVPDVTFKHRLVFPDIEPPGCQMTSFVSFVNRVADQWTVLDNIRCDNIELIDQTSSIVAHTQTEASRGKLFLTGNICQQSF